MIDLYVFGYRCVYVCLCCGRIIYKESILGEGLKGYGKVVQEDRESMLRINRSISLM